MLTLDTAALVRRAFLEHLGMERTDLGRLRSLPVDAILGAQAAAFVATMVQTGLMPFHPVDDGDVVDGPPLDAFRAGRARGVDLVIGTMRDELQLFPDPGGPALEDARLVDRIARGLGGDDAGAARALIRYRRRLGEGATAGAVWDAIRTDTTMWVPNLRIADAHSSHHAATYVYRFDWEAPEIGAAHAVDIPFTFGTFDREGWGRGRRVRRARRVPRHRAARGVGRIRAPG